MKQTLDYLVRLYSLREGELKGKDRSRRTQSECQELEMMKVRYEKGIESIRKAVICIKLLEELTRD